MIIDGKIVKLRAIEEDDLEMLRTLINDKNTEYKRLSIEYYNLLKNTVNIFHVIENSPHFKEMINGLKLSHEMLNSTSKKYNFLFSKSRDIIRKRSLDLHINSDEYNKIKIKIELHPLKIFERTARAQLYLASLLFLKTQ